MTELNNVRITFSGGRTVTIERLDIGQQVQLSALCQASGVRYQWHSWLVSGPATRPSFQWWRRLMAWMMPLLFVAFLSSTAMAQQALRPVKVSIVATAEESETDAEFNRYLRAELNKLKTVAFTSQSDFDIGTAAVPITERGRTIAYAVASMIVSPEGARRRRFNLSIRIGPSLEELAAELAQKLDEEYFKKEK